MKRFLGSLYVCALLVAITASAQAVQYRIVDLGTLGGTNSVATGLNSNGQVVGYSYNTERNDFRAFLWQSGSPMQDLGTLEGTYSKANGINDNGQVVGESNSHAFLWQNGSPMQDLGTLGGTYSVAMGINNNGQIVGDSHLPEDIYGYGPTHGFLWKSGSLIKDLGTLVDDNSYARGINNSGQVVGGSDEAFSTGAFLWQDGSPMQSLGTPAGTTGSFAYAINSNSQVVGASGVGSHGYDRRPHAFFWQNGTTMQDLGTLGGWYSEAYAINNDGQVVGDSDDHAFLWQNGSTMQDLATSLESGWRTVARGINSNGQIVGTATNANGISHAIMWQPIADQDPSVTFTAPTAGPFFITYNSTTIDISGTASATAGLDSVTWTNDRGGSGTCNGTTAWSATGIILQLGDNIITVTAKDTTGKTSFAVLRIISAIPMPTVVIDYPTDMSVYSTYASTIDVSGHAVDPIGLSSVTWANDRGGSGTCGGTTYWDATSIGLQPGDNIITITATNTSGNSSSSTIKVTRIAPTSIGAAKKMPQNSLVAITDAVVTAAGFENNTLFIESSDRSAGVKLVTNMALSEGDSIEFTGIVSQVDGEYQIRNVVYMNISADTPNYLKPIFMTSKSICNDITETLNYTGINTTGLVVSMMGKVTGVDAAQRIMYIDDGGRYSDQVGGYTGIRVHIPSLATIPVKDQRVLLNGISRVEKLNNLYVPSIWIRDAGDILVY